MAEKFSLAASLAPVSESDTTGREQIEYIDIAHIHPDERNFYELSGIEELAASIELVGLQQPLRVRPGEEKGEYIVVSGHRRHAALNLLVQEGKEQFRQTACIVEKQSGAADEVETWLQELRLICGNSDTRKLSPADISKQAERVEELLYRLKDAGMEFPGRMRDHVAEACKVKGSKLARLKVIREKLVPPAYVKLWEAGKLPEQTAYAIARMEPLLQEELAKACPKKLPDGRVAEEIQRKGMVAYLTRDQKCPDGEACTNGARILSRDAHVDYSWKVGQCGCCADCHDNMTCQYVCPQGRAAGEKKRRKKKEAEEARQKTEKERKDAKAREMITAFARRVAAAAGTKERLEQAIKAANEKLTQAGTSFSYGGSLSKAAFDGEIAYTWYGYYCPDAVALAAICRELGCSADYLLGLSDKPLLERAGK
ncbi:ParB/RepB/Spo0J family partition protein [Vermiculatibacterium agrestimuris]|uniref:ParB/RepB/Spo0J family partition protein n=1 Tax=Vermiculatibacterium agrestimuris TaxID=2941519 RepID=UPI00204258AB|nr:ParB/RepB/Spo0J family partition protein [Vermiculatibacterium agrestimuris]